MTEKDREWKNVPGTEDAHEDMLIEIDSTEGLQLGDMVDDVLVIAEWTRPDA